MTTSERSSNSLCAAAKVQKGSFYHFFPSKRDLALAVIDDMAEDWAHGFVAEAFDQHLPPLERLDYLIDAACPAACLATGRWR